METMIIYVATLYAPAYALLLDSNPLCHKRFYIRLCIVPLTAAVAAVVAAVAVALEEMTISSFLSWLMWTSAQGAWVWGSRRVSVI